jgi:hypothetical protein
MVDVLTVCLGRCRLDGLLSTVNSPPGLLQMVDGLLSTIDRLPLTVDSKKFTWPAENGRWFTVDS